MRRTTITLAAAALTLALASTALAGGWAVTSFDELPERFEAGTTHSLDYTIRAHGETPVDSGASFVTFRDGKDSHRFDAVNHGDGTYSVEVTLPHNGTWSWSVTSEGWGTQDLGSLQVTSATAAVGGFDLVDLLKVALPLATLIAALVTIREWAKMKEGSAPAETG